MSNLNDFWNFSSKVFLNPRTSSTDREKIVTAVEDHPLDQGFWVRSSGTESFNSGIKLVGLSKQAFFSAARSVNTFFKVSPSDLWLNPLPLFHVGGLAVRARCFLSGAQEVYLDDWSAEDFMRKSVKESATLTSLVPTQVFDLVKLAVKAPKSFRLVLVGGGALNSDLYIRARELGWPLIPSYGMTETSAVMAAYPLASISDPAKSSLQVLPHITMHEQQGRVSVSSQALYSKYLIIDDKVTLIDRPDPFFLDDRIIVSKNKTIQVLGRESELVKISGETVNLVNLEERVSKLIGKTIVVLAKPEERRGYELILVREKSETIVDLQKLNQTLMPFERIKFCIDVAEIPKTALGKIKRAELSQMLF